MGKKVISELEKDMDNFINDYLCGVFKNFITANRKGEVKEGDIFKAYCDISKCFDIFCEKLQAEKQRDMEWKDECERRKAI